MKPCWMLSKSMAAEVVWKVCRRVVDLRRSGPNFVNCCCVLILTCSQHIHHENPRGYLFTYSRRTCPRVPSGCQLILITSVTASGLQDNPSSFTHGSNSFVARSSGPKNCPL